MPRRISFEITLLYCTGMFAAMQLGLFGPMVPALQMAFDSDKASIALASSLITGAGACCGIFAGAWIAQVGYKRALIIGSALMIAGMVGVSFSPNLMFLYACRFFSGFGYLIVVTACPGLMCALVSGRLLNLVMGFWGTFVPVGVAIGAWLSGALVERYGWEMVTLLSILPCALALVGLFFLESPTQPSRTMRLGQAIMPTLRNPSARYVSIAFSLFAGATQAIALFLPSTLIETGDWSLANAATLVGIGSLVGGCIGSVLAGGLMARGWSGVTLFAAALVLLAIVSTTLLTGPGLAVAILATGLFFFGQGICGGAGFALLPAVAAQGLTMAVLQGMFTHINEIAVVAIPPVFGFTVDMHGWSGAAILALVVFALSLAAILRFGVLTAQDRTAVTLSK
ncbi:MFS transporter [Aestuariispira ectoiniformans]|uniref:MFS transporter n=1 Tax=Aestuariispira ectoiniformans TaxID=2775080 RepID=UPI00223BAC3D|nr:MFS transporter [Aestuariispira ectoiniformans]